MIQKESLEIIISRLLGGRPGSNRRPPEPQSGALTS